MCARSRPRTRRNGRWSSTISTYTATPSVVPIYHDPTQPSPPGPNAHRPVSPYLTFPHTTTRYNLETYGSTHPILGGQPWNDDQRAFFFPLAYQEEAWAYSQEIQGGLDLVLHPNTGCMHDDHSVRSNWVVSPYQEEAPIINIMEFPCNYPVSVRCCCEALVRL